MRRDTTSHAILELAQRLCCRAHFSRFELYWRLVSRALLRERGLTVSGRHTQLVQRLLEDMEVEQAEDEEVDGEVEEDADDGVPVEETDEQSDGGGA